MCQLRKDNRLQKPKIETFIAYKVFECHGGKPWNYTGKSQFKFGNNVWYEDKAANDGFEGQLGFQMFAYKKDAVEYATTSDIVCPVTVKTKNIKRVGRACQIGQYGSTRGNKAYEVTIFELKRKNWEKEKSRI